MTTAYTTLLGLALPVQGELQGTWGDEVNNYITNYLDAAVAGTQTISGSQTAVTLSKTTGSSLSQAGSGATGSSQYFVINCTGNPAGTLTITAPAASKAYLIINATSTSQDVKIVGAGPTTGVTLVSGERAIVSWNGSDFVKVANFGGVGSFTTISATTGNITTVNATTVDTTNLEVTNIKAKDGTASMTLADSTGVASFSANPVFSGGTANGVLYLNGSKVATSGTALAFDGTALTVGTNGLYLSGNTGGAAYMSTSAAGAATELILGTSGNIPIRFIQNNAEQMRLTSTGLGIGTSSPSVRLQILDAGGANSTGTMRLGGATYYGTIQHDPTTTGANIYDVTSASGGGHIFRRGGSDLMRLDSSGNLGLGVTPSAWATYKATQVGWSALAGYAAADTAVFSNAFFDGGYKYIGNGFASQYRQINSAHQWFTAPSGNAGDPISFTQALTLDASGNLGVGITNPAQRLDVRGTTSATIRVGSTGNGGSGDEFGNLEFYWADPDAAEVKAKIYAKNVGNVGPGGGGAADLLFATTPAGGSSTERARITSGGDLLVGTTAAGYQNSNSCEVGIAGRFVANHVNGTSSGAFYAAFGYNSVGIGSITQDGTTAVLYNTASDRRLKQNIVPAPSASDVIDAIQIVSHDWKAAPDEHVTYGVIAQDLHAVAPQAVSVGDAGDEIEKAWGVDYSKLVPMLIKEIQSLRARVAALEAQP